MTPTTTLNHSAFYAFCLCFAIPLFTLSDSFGQAVSINSTGTAPDAQSILDVSSTTKGVLLPRMTSAQRTAIAPTATSDFGMTVYDLTTDSYWYWDGASWQEIPNMGNIPAVTLDAAYDGGGSGAGRTINADQGAVQITNSNLAYSLDLDKGIRMAEDQWIGLGSTIERIVFDGTLDRIDIEVSDVTMDDGKWIGIDGSSPRVRYTDGAPGIIDLDDANLRVDDGVWFGLGSNIERFVFQGADDEVNLMNAELGIGTLAPTQTLDVNGSIRMRGGTTTSGFMPVSSGDGTMVWTDPTTLGLDVTTASNGLTEVTNDIRLGGSLTQNTVVAQAGWTLGFTSTAVDGFSVDGTTFSVDASNNRIGIGTAAPTTPLHISSTADDVVRVQGADHSRLLVDGTDASEKSIGFSESAVIQWRAGMDDSNGAGGNANDFAVKQVNDASPEFVIQASSGNVGIGTNSPDAKLNVGDAAGATIYLTREDGITVTDDILGSLLFDSTDDTSPSTTDASAGIRAFASQTHGNSNKGGYLTFMTKNNVGFAAPATERMRIQADGNVAIGATTASVKLYVAGDATITGKFNSNGIEELSDVRYKKNIEKLNNSLQKVLQVDGVSYNWRKDEFPERTFGDRTEIGFIAQELEKVFPELVNTDKEGYKSVQYSHMVPVLLEAIKEQQALMAGMQQQIGTLSAAMESANAAFEARLQQELKAITQQLQNSSNTRSITDADHR